MSLVVIRCHSLSLVASRCTTPCHLLSFVVTRCTTRCHSLSLDVSLGCLFMNDRLITDFFLVENWATLGVVRIVVILVFLKLLKYEGYIWESFSFHFSGKCFNRNFKNLFQNILKFLILYFSICLCGKNEEIKHLLNEIFFLTFSNSN